MSTPTSAATAPYTPSVTSPTNNLLAEALTQHSKTKPKLGSDIKGAPHILIIGKTGTGKSRSIINLPPEQTVILNVEEKILPFEGALKFKDNTAINFEYSTEIESCLKKVVELPQIKYIVVDSLSKFLEMMMVEERAKGGGWEIMNRYNLRLYQLFQFTKKITNKIIIFTSLDEIMADKKTDGSIKSVRVATTDGKWLGKIESEFSTVLFTDVEHTREGTNVKRSYKFLTNNDSTFTAKSPENLFPYQIDNDLYAVIKKVEGYFGLNKSNPVA